MFTNSICLLIDSKALFNLDTDSFFSLSLLANICNNIIASPQTIKPRNLFGNC